MSRIAAFAALAVICCAGAAAPAAPLAPYARPPAGLTTFYAGPTKVDLAGRPVIADIALHADMAAAQKGALKIALTTDVTTFVDQTEKDLKDYIAGRTSACGERWSSNEPEISFPADSIRFTMEIAVELWQCGLDGKAKPARMTRDGGRIDVTLAPYVSGGKLQARLGDLKIVVTDGLGKYMPLEFLVRRAVEGELKKLNQNPKFYRAPEPIYSEMLRYDSIAAQISADKRVIITARFGANGSAKAFERIAARMKSEGVRQ